MNWEDLVVISTAGNIPGQHSWRASRNIFPAETCARHIYIGLHEDFFESANKSSASISAVTADEKTTLYQGRDAIVFLIAFCAGLGSHYQIDEKISGQICNKWNGYNAEFPESHARLKPYMDKIFADAALLKKCILNPHLKRPTYTNTAIEMAKLSRDSKTLLIVEDEAMSKKMLTALGHGRHDTPDHITIAHPYGINSAKSILATAMQAGITQKHNRITTQVTVEPFEHVIDKSSSKRIVTFFNAQAIFLCNRYDNTAVADAVTKAWKSRVKRAERQNGKLIQLTKAEDNAGSNPIAFAWDKLTLSDNYFPFASIEARTLEHMQRVNQVLQITRAAIEHIADLKLEGDRVRDIALMPDMTLKYVLASRPMGSPHTQSAPSRQQRSHRTHAVPG
ncbi:MAG: hypothetical protein ABTQ34_00290 [Bdellovibrionales bacterium]